MRTNRIASIATALLLALTFTVPVVTGCAFLKRVTGNETTQRTTYNTIWSLAAGVDAGYRAYWDLVIADKLTTNSVPKVSAAYDSFQGSLKIALVLVEGNTNALPTQSLADSAANFNTVVTAARKDTP